MRIPDFKNLELKHVTFSKGYDDKDTLNLEIIALFIDKKFRNKGYGAKIIHKLEKILWNERHRSKDKGIQIITGINNYKAQRLYMSLGYTEYKRNELYIFYNKKGEDI